MGDGGRSGEGLEAMAAAYYIRPSATAYEKTPNSSMVTQQRSNTPTQQHSSYAYVMERYVIERLKGVRERNREQ